MSILSADPQAGTPVHQNIATAEEVWISYCMPAGILQKTHNTWSTQLNTNVIYYTV